jgi:S1-C subfamily serine protease
MGAKTRAAVQAFQREQGGQMSGEVDETLLAQLKQAVEKDQRATHLPKIPTMTKRGRPPLPPALSGKPLEASEVYRRVQSSVFVLLAANSPDALRRKQGVSQGSAVAISSSRLLTSCHILAGRPHASLLQGESSYPARLVRSNQRNDRCVLEVSSTNLDPIKGVRPFSDLAVGEKVYTLGAPSGLDRTLGEGIISGLRQGKGSKLVQFSAPISRGSSGGGLFDRWGNLIGITTFLVKETQNLNFAIAAEQFWE